MNRGGVLLALTLGLTACAAGPDEIPSFTVLESTSEAPPAPSVDPEAWEDVDPDPVTLRHVFRPGQRVVYEVLRNRAVDRGRPTAQGEAARPVRLLEAEELVEFEVLVSGVDEWGGARLRITPIRLEIEREGPDGDAELDTEDGIPSGDDELDAEAQRVGVALTANVDHRGRLLSLEGADVHLERVADQLPVVRRWDALEDFEQRLGDRGLMRQLQEMFVIVPEEQLRPGDTWEELLPTGNPDLEGGGLFRQTYVYLGLVEHEGERCAKVFFWRVYEGRDEEGHGQRTWVPPHAAQGSLYLRVRDGMLVEAEPLTEERLVVHHQGRHLEIFRGRDRVSRRLLDEW